MTSTGPEGEGPTMATPEELFGILGNETRLQILYALADADGPLSFSALFDRTPYGDSANFDYHLEKLVGNFVRKTDAGYALQQRGRRVIEAILAGTLTESPTIDRTATDAPCPRCGAPIDVRYRHERVELYCETCNGSRTGANPTADWAASQVDDIVGYVDLPPAGIEGRTPAEVVRAAEIWTVAETQVLARDVCPRCSAHVEHSIQVCDSHDGTGDVCETCGGRFAATVTVRCTNCVLDQESVFTKHLLGHPDVIAFMAEQGIDPMAPDGFHLDADERIVSRTPLVVEYVFTAGEHRLVVTVDDTGSVVDLERKSHE